MPLRRLVGPICLALVMGLVPWPRTAAAAELTGSAPEAASIGVAHMSEQSPVTKRAADGSYSVLLNLGGAQVELQLHPYSLRRPSAQAFAEGPGGVRTPIALPPVSTYRGTVRGDVSGVVAATLDGNNVRARILLDDGSDWYVQPVAGSVAGAHAIYRGTDVAPSTGTCAADGAPATTSEALAPATTREPLASAQVGQSVSSGCVDAEIAVEAEYAYYVWNGSSTTQTISDIDAIMNAVELIYARDVKIGYKITNYLIQTSSGKYSSSDPNTKMNQFQTWWNANQASVPRDLAHLFTGPMNNGQLGVAYYSVICQTSQAYGISNSYWTTNWANRVATTAHELGHNWGATHCNAQADCAIMCTNIGLCSGVMTRFSASSIREIETYRNQSGACLSAGTGTSIALNPTARDDRVVALKDTPITINVLANDFDPNCTAIRLGTVAPTTTNNATVAVSGDNLVYTPPAGFTGMDIFQYTVLDASNTQNTGNVFVSVQDYAPAVPATGAVAGLQVRYYYVPPLDGSLGSMPTLSNPFKVETVPALLFPATNGTVGESGLKDRMAARCTGSINVTTAASYTFYLTASDGAKLYIDNSLVVDDDGLHGIQERSAIVSLTTGSHDVRVDYYEETGIAGLKLEIAGGGITRTSIPASMWASPGVQIAYYQLDSTIMPPFAALVPEKTQAITTINYPFSWGTFAGSGRSVDVGAVFEGFITVPTDNVYNFEITSEDGSRFYIDDALVVDNDGYHNRVALTGGRALKAGAHPFRLEYFARDGGCALQIQVSSSTLTKQIVPSTWWSHIPTFHVPTDYATIASAITAATANSKVWVAAGTYTGSGNKNLDLGGKNIALVGGGGPELTILDAQNSGRLFNFVNHSQTAAVVDGFTLCHAANTAGGVGGAMSFNNSTLTVRNCFIEGNTNPGNGGALGFTGTSAPTFDTCVISGNHSDSAGGAISADAGTNPTFLGCTVTGNFTDTYGGGAYAVNGGKVTFTRTILWGNSSVTDGAEAWTADGASSVAFNCSDVRSNGVGGGGSKTYDSNTMVSDPLFCVPAPGSLAPTTAGGYRVVGNSPVLSMAGTCGAVIGARGIGCATSVTGIDETPVIRSTALAQNAPNPFNPVTRISFSIEHAGRASLRIFDVAGRLVATLVDQNLSAGSHSIVWRGLDSRNRQVATGVYFYELRSGADVLTRSMVLLK